MGTLSLWHWLIFLAIVCVPVAGFILTRKRPGSADYRSLRIISPTLNFFVVMAFVGRPFLEHFKRNGWHSDTIPPGLLFALGLFFLVCVYVGVGATAYYFYRAKRNINYFARTRQLWPSSAWLMVVPAVNVVAMPYIWGSTYYRSLALHPAHQVRKLTAAAMSIGAFGLVIIGLAAGMMSGKPALWPPGYDGLSLTIVAVCTSAAGTMLFTRIVQRISAAQELFAEHLGLVVARSRNPGGSISAGVVDLLKSVAFGACIGLALVSVAWPALVSSALEQFRTAAFGQVARLETELTRSEILEATAMEINKSAPQQLDQVTRLDRARVEGDQFVYEYTLTIDKLTDSDLSNVRSNVVPAFCTGEMKNLRQLNAVLVYRYRYANGTLAGQVAVSERECN